MAQGSTDSPCPPVLSVLQFLSRGGDRFPRGVKGKSTAPDPPQRLRWLSVWEAGPHARLPWRVDSSPVLEFGRSFVQPP